VSISVQIMFGVLVVIGYLVTPVVLIWGWTRLDKMDAPTNAPNCPGYFVPDRIRSCNSLSRRRRFRGCVCSSSPLSVLRSIASQNISGGTFAFSRRNPVRHRWRVATGSVALARAYLRAWNVRILVSRGIGRVIELTSVWL
jgi:hypothetical protein